MTFKTIEDIKAAKFFGFKTVRDLTAFGLSDITSAGGVYMILRQNTSAPKFVKEGTGGFFKGKNPNVSIEELESNWVDDTCVLYIGKATSMKKRLSQYMHFGSGSAVGHWGGRYIWQLEDARNLIVCWKPTQEDPGAVESSLIAEFTIEYGMRPFANLRD